jgi:hypothetical protein
MQLFQRAVFPALASALTGAKHMNFSTWEHLIFKSLCAFIQEQAVCGQVSLRATYMLRRARDIAVVSSKQPPRDGGERIVDFGQVELREEETYRWSRAYSFLNVN